MVKLYHTEEERRKARCKASKKFKVKTRKTHWHINILSAIKTRCKQNKLEFNLTKEDIVVPEYCPVLGIKLLIDQGRDNSPSVDRIDNSRGYTKDNIRVISNRANRFKSDASLEELKLLAADYIQITKF